MAELPAVLDPSALAPYLAEVKGLVQRAKAENTLAAYRSDWKAFGRFCDRVGVPSLPAAPATVAAYAAEAARSLKARTIERRFTAISQVHKIQHYPDPVKDELVRGVMAGIRREKGTAQVGKEPLSAEVLRQMFEGAPDDLRTLRDRALLLVGFGGAFRRSELVALRFEDIQFTPAGLVVTIPKFEDRSSGGRANRGDSFWLPPRELPGAGPSGLA